MKTFIFLLLISNLSWAQKVNGEKIKSADFNSSTFNLGDIKQTLLPELQFRQMNGDCWVQMKGQSIAGSDYAVLTGTTQLPDAQGRFLRTAGGNAAPLAQTQEDEFKSHTHLQNEHSHLGGYPRANGYSYATHGALNGTTTGGNTYVAAEASGLYLGRYAYTTVTTAVNQNSGGIETRPRNLTVNTFIKINKNCSF